VDNTYLLYRSSLHLGRVKNVKFSIRHVHQLLTCTTENWLFVVH
jgi:hypothetical protein